MSRTPEINEAQQLLDGELVNQALAGRPATVAGSQRGEKIHRGWATTVIVMSMRN